MASALPLLLTDYVKRLALDFKHTSSMIFHLTDACAQDGSNDRNDRFF